LPGTGGYSVMAGTTRKSRPPDPTAPIKLAFRLGHPTRALHLNRALLRPVALHAGPKHRQEGGVGLDALALEGEGGILA